MAVNHYAEQTSASLQTLTMMPFGAWMSCESINLPTMRTGYSQGGPPHLAEWLLSVVTDKSTGGLELDWGLKHHRDASYHSKRTVQN